MVVPMKEINFRKRINKINTLRAILREKKTLLAKLRYVPEANDECLKLSSEVKELENKINRLTNCDDADSRSSLE